MVVVTMILALLYLTALGISGVAVLRRLTCQMTQLEKWAYGLPLGNVVWSLVTLLLASVIHRLTVPIVVASAVLSIALALWLWPWGDLVAALRPRRTAKRGESEPPPSPAEQLARFVVTTVGPLSAFVIVAFAIRWTILWRGALVFDAQGLMAGHVNIWGDWALHLGDVTSFVYGDNFPPVNSRYLGIPLIYHYLPSVTASSLVKLGLAPTAALAFHSWFFCLVLLLGLYAFALRLTRDRNVAGVSIVLFLLGGTFGWVSRLAEMDKSHNFWGTFLRQPWDRGAAGDLNFRWPNMFFDLIESQRAYVYGLPLALLMLTLLVEGHAQRKRILYLAAGVVGGALPFAHLSTLTALALIIPFVFLFLVPSETPFPVGWNALWRAPGRFFGAIGQRGGGLVVEYLAALPNWLIFGVAWLVLAVPQLIVQQGGQSSDVRLIRWDFGWIAPPDPWPWFWLKNLGWFIPLLLLALANRRLLDSTARRLLWAFMPTFVICNLFAFRPWDWDNTKMLFYWFLAVSILVAALLVRAWREQGTALVRTLIVGVVATMVLTGVLMNAQQLLGKDRYQIVNTEEVRLAETVREQTDPHAIFVTGTQHNHPIPVLAGRQVLMSYPGWLFSSGIDYAQRERDLRTIYAFTADAPRLLASYNIDYIVIGPANAPTSRPTPPPSAPATAPR